MLYLKCQKVMDGLVVIQTLNGEQQIPVPPMWKHTEWLPVYMIPESGDHCFCLVELGGPNLETLRGDRRVWVEEKHLCLDEPLSSEKSSSQQEATNSPQLVSWYEY